MWQSYWPSVCRVGSRTCCLCSYIGCLDADLSFVIPFYEDVGVLALAFICSKHVKVHLFNLFWFFVKSVLPFWISETGHSPSIQLVLALLSVRDTYALMSQPFALVGV